MIPSTNISVEDFFQQANWQGLRLVAIEKESLSDTIEIEDNFYPTFNLTVQDFFASHNWQGVVKTKKTRASEELYQPMSVNYSLTMTVGEFFQRISWQGQGRITQKKTSIASLPSISSSETFDSTAKTFNVNDLSDLL
ncbi:hypothetical protein [Geminocystis sp. NIES-3709]|uniref:hypothetical protein n=1 Tax=Geminocystis sp. NIES-3709 TaxID=1617448 RepID=UPI0005FC56DB|nr:hypothetical protein [Geminocystis sp. NIES-3709]BAQ64328.1 hypothetical protein GM3709_1093 [Geminocystis sp. NIES-3709]